jgi:hypothetical protein
MNFGHSLGLYGQDEDRRVGMFDAIGSGEWTWKAGTTTAEGMWTSFAFLNDPDGNGWILKERPGPRQ